MSSATNIVLCDSGFKICKECEGFRMLLWNLKNAAKKVVYRQQLRLHWDEFEDGRDVYRGLGYLLFRTLPWVPTGANLFLTIFMVIWNVLNFAICKVCHVLCMYVYSVVISVLCVLSCTGAIYSN